MVFATPQDFLPQAACPAGAVGCSPVLTEPSYHQVALHTFVRVQMGTRDDAVEADDQGRRAH